jgi:hypothetical protein
MAVAYRSQTKFAYATGVNTTINKPAGVVDGDILVAYFYISDVTVTAPSGWTEYSGSPFETWAAKARVYWKRASSEGSSWTWTHNSATRLATVNAYSGAISSGNPNDCTAASNHGHSNKACVALSITTATNNALVIFLNVSTIGGMTAPTGYTLHGDGSECNKIYTTAGATGNQTGTFAVNNSWHSFHMALKPPVTDIKSVSGVPYDSIKSISGIPVASIKSVSGLA